MNPSRKRRIRLVAALTAALLAASALAYTSFSAGSDERTASQLLDGAVAGRTYTLAGTVAKGSVHRAGERALLRRARSAPQASPCACATPASCRTRSAKAAA